MADDVQIFSVAIPPGGSASSPQTFNLTMPARIVQSVEIVVPSGVRGFVGFALGAAGTPVIPSNAGAYIITDDEIINWPISGQINSGAWQCFAYNLGFFTHTLQIRFLLGLLPGPAQVVSAIQPLVGTTG